MRALPVFRRSLADSWRPLIAWAIAIVAVLALYLPLYPDIGGNGQLAQIIEGLPQGLVNALGYASIGTGAGYAQATFYGLMGFLLLSIASISWGGAAIAGAEESGRLELDLAHGVGRTQYALESALTLVVKLAALVTVAGVMVWTLNGPAELGLDAEGVLAASVSLMGLTLIGATAALAVGALTGRRAFATAAGAAIAVYGYALNAIANQSERLDWLRNASPYSWAFESAPLAEGFDWPRLALLWGISAALVAVAAVALRRRDVLG
ncbi:ABC transporter permease subunit [Ruicaihuangia caeni]|uniref:ABC transporter permease subunit n=1 Tax=Ruicaihuangia caeni TaxID=3042517 RepID=A0AAW6T5S9_9MICO|nr:ABC transporter permease subunit [Klugiella sp. YN-L-19]MDI2099186.1 ABC transporter permease subunit [Klugiella sp. YN-L-19]